MGKFDLGKTNVLMDLFAIPWESRDDQWRHRFYEVVPDATLRAFDSQGAKGPDGFPYFQFAVPDPGPVTPFCVSHVLDVCLVEGFGIAIYGNSSRSDPPEWVFTNGNLLSYSLFGDFDGNPSEPGSAGGSSNL